MTKHQNALSIGEHLIQPGETKKIYSRLLFALILGAIVFGERPDAYMLTGSAIVIAAGLYTLIREARLARAAQQAQSTLSSDPTSR